LTLDKDETKKLDSVHDSVIKIEGHLERLNGTVARLQAEQEKLDEATSCNSRKIYIGMGAAIGISAMATLLSALSTVLW